MYTYYAYNLCISSEVELPELTQVEDTPDVYVRLRSLDSLELPPRTSFFQIVGELTGIAKFFIQNGSEIYIEPLPDTHPLLLSPNILGGCMVIILMQRGWLTLHASCTVINGNAVAFLGKSGAGKSTLAAAFYAKGYPLITDDVLPVAVKPERVSVIPSFPRIKLWPESLAAAAGSAQVQLKPLYQGTHKWSYISYEWRYHEAFPLKHIYLLDQGDKHAIFHLEPQTAFRALLHHRRTVEGFESPELGMQLLLQISNLINQVTVKRFVRRPSLEALPELVNLVEKDLAKD